MNRLLQKGLFLILIIAVVLFSFSVYAQQAPQQKKGKTILDYKNELKLTNAQVEKIKTYIADLQKELQKLRERLVSVNKEINQLLQEGIEKKGNIKLPEVEAKIKESYGIRAEMVIAEIRTAKKINEVLTPEQFEKWKKIVRESGRKK